MAARLLIAAWAIAFCTLAWGSDPPPDWLKEVASRQVPEYASDIEAVVLFDEESVRVDGPGKVTVSRRGAIRVLQRNGDKRAAERIVYTTDADRVRKLKGWILYPSGGNKTLEEKDVVERALSNGNAYDEARIQVLSAEGQADPGAVFGFESVLERRRIFAQFVYGFQDDLPVLTGRFNMDLPAGGTAQAVTLNAPPIEPLVQGSRYTWELRNLPPIRREEAGPSYSALAPRVAATYFPPAGAAAEMSFADWSAVGAWLNELSAPPMEPDAAVAQKAHELTAGVAGAWEKVKAIGEFVQGVTYVSIQIGTGRGGGYTPHPAPQVLRNLYGDCKDKVTLMRSLLESVGIRSHLTAIYSGDQRYVRQEWPSPHQFNHVIVAIEAPDGIETPAVGDWEGFGRLLLFDPTDPYTPLGQLPAYEQDSWALLTAPASGLLIRVPSAAPEQNRVEREASVVLSTEGNIEVSLKESSIGQSATENRALRARGSEAEYRSVIEKLDHAGYAGGGGWRGGSPRRSGRGFRFGGAVRRPALRSVDCRPALGVQAGDRGTPLGRIPDRYGAGTSCAAGGQRLARDNPILAAQRLCGGREACPTSNYIRRSETIPRPGPLTAASSCSLGS